MTGGLRDRLTLPVIVAPMFLCSGVELAIASCAAGVVGSLTRNHCRDFEEFEVQLNQVAAALARFADDHSDRRVGPLAVNISPTFSNDEFRRHLAACRRAGVATIITSVGDPTLNAPLVRDYGMLHFHDATTLRFAEKAVAASVDGIVCIGSGGGGHAGALSHLAFIPLVREMFAGTVVMAGGVTTGGAIRAAEVLGADLAYMGTRFIATRESSAPVAYKAMLVESGATDVLYTRAVNGVPASWLTASLKAIGLDPDDLHIPDRRGTDHLPPGKTPWRDIWSGGQGVGLIRDVPTVAALVRRLQEEYIAACDRPDLANAAQASLTITGAGRD